MDFNSEYSLKLKDMKLLFIIDITFKLLFYIVGYGLVIGSFFALFALPWIMTYQ